MKQIIVYGGSFNPPTIAHVLIAQELICQAHDTGAELWLLPSGDRRDKLISVSRAARLEYIKAMIKSCRRHAVKIRIITSELDRKVPTETIDTVRRFQKLYPKAVFTWVFGSDSVITMKQWHEGEWLFDNLKMIIARRPGFEDFIMPPNATPLELTQPEMSSTEVRQRLSQGLSIESLVAPKVLKAILAHAA